MSDEIILNLSFDNQTVTDLTGNWILDGTPNATYEQIEGRDGYSIVEGSLGRCIVLNAVDQNAVYNEYTVDFDMFVKSTYTSNYYIYYVFYLWSRKDPAIVGSFRGKIGEILSISPEIGSSSPVGTTDYSPIGRWVHVTITSGPTGEGNSYHTAVYVDGVKLTERTDSRGIHGGNPFGISQRIIPCARDPGSFLMPNGPGVCLNTYKIVAGIHAPDQKPAISLPNLSRVFQNFCTWLGSQLSAVAKSGSYNDLSDKPTIPTVNNATLTIQRNGTTIDTFTANASVDKTINISTTDDTKIPLAGTDALSGSIVPDTDNAYDLGDSTYGFANFYANKIYLKGSTIFNLVDDNYICVGGATAQANGANLVLNGKNRSTSTGEFKLEARDGTYTRQLIGKPDGTLSWGGTVSANDIVVYSVASRDTSNSSVLYLLGGSSYPNGAQINLYGNNHQNNGCFEIIAHGNSQVLRGEANGTLTWDGQPIQYTSDARLKQQISQIDDDLLTAWEDVNPVQFKYNGAVDQKGDNARLHTGYVVQQIDSACKSHGVDISEYGLYCHEEYPEETEEVEVEQADGTKTKEKKVIREASEHYSLRYTEALIVECAYLRKKLKELTARIEELEKGNKEAEK